MIVLDASAGVAALLNDGPARRLLASESIHVPHLIDVEVASALRRLNAVGLVDDANAQGALSAWATLGLIRYAAPPMLDRVWELRASVSAYDANYVALAENLGCDLVTTDARLAAVNGMRCSITVVPR